MVRLTNERILLISDSHRSVQDALVQAAPGAHIVSVNNIFDGIAELTANRYSTILASVEPIERRPDAAVRTLRHLATGARLLLFGQPTLEPLSRKMLEFGCDDYIVTPASAAELIQIFGVPPMRLTTPAQGPAEPTELPAVEFPAISTRLSQLDSLALSEIMLDSLLHNPDDAPGSALARINTHLAPTMQLAYLAKDAAPPGASEGLRVISLPVHSNDQEVATLHLIMPQDEDETAARHFLSQFAQLMGRLSALQERHNRLQKLAITDDLTGIYNGRFFRHFLTKIVERSRQKMFPVTLLLFDIDNFKKYNDQFGHGIGDEILKQTALLMRRSVRDHDLVARIAGDEFAVVFWEKESHREVRDPAHAGTAGKPPQDVTQICQRFLKRLATPDFTVIGPMGQGVLTISGGLAVFPYHANGAAELIEAADRALMFGAKTSGKNSIYLVGEGDPPPLAKS
jgi:diguanylate cyclase (GGDEF)-like protein